MSQILIELQNLLPTFEPKVLNSMLVLKTAFDATPGADKVMDEAGERFLLIAEAISSNDLELRIHLNLFDEIERRIRAEGGR